MYCSEVRCEVMALVVYVCGFLRLKYLLVALILCYLAETTCSFRNGGMYTRLIGRGFDGDPPINSLSQIATNSGNERISLKLGDFVSNSTNFFLANQTTNASVSSFVVKSLSTFQDSITHIEKQISLWWEMISMGRKELLLILAPTIASQFRMLQTTVPFCIDHIMQYLHPLSIGLVVALSQSKGTLVLRNFLMGIIAMGVGQMLKDSFFSGASWLPARPLADSYALITGASSGLGKSIAFHLFETGYNVILVGRNESVLEDVRQEFYTDVKKLISNSLKTKSYEAVAEPVTTPTSDVEIVSDDTSSEPETYICPRNIEVITTNLAHPLSSFQILRELKLRGLENKIDILVANAGQGHHGKMHQTAWSDIREQLELNVASAVSLIRLMIPRMILRRHQQLCCENTTINNNCQNNILESSRGRNAGSRILVISSVAGEGPGADIATYSAAKAFLSTFALSIRRELFPEGIMVTVAKPGPLIGTQFLSKVPSMRHIPMVFSIPFFAMQVDNAARQIVQAMILGREMVCPGFFPKVQVHIISKLLPASLYAASVQRLWKPFPAIKKANHLPPNPDHRESPEKDILKPHSSASSQYQQRRNHFHKWPSLFNFKASLKQWYETFFSDDLTRRDHSHKSGQSESFDKQHNSFQKKLETERVYSSPGKEVNNLQQAEEDAEISALSKFSLFAGYPAVQTQHNNHKDGNFSPTEVTQFPSTYVSSFSADEDIDMENENIVHSPANYLSPMKMVHI